MRLLYFIVLLFLSSIVYGQKSVLLQNTNTRAQELKHYLNKTEDSIAFKCDRTIYELMVFNEEGFERVIKVKDTVAQIKISDIPVGRYAIEAVLRDKLIIITLLRNESFGLEEPTPLIARPHRLNHNKIIKQKNIIASAENAPKKLKTYIKGPARLDSLTHQTLFGTENNKGRTDLSLSGKKATHVTETSKRTINTQKTDLISNRIPSYPTEAAKSTLPRQPQTRAEDSKTNNSKYWVVYKMNNGIRSEKVLKIADQKTVDRMILKNEIDRKTKSGQLNELTVWEIYDTTNFARHKRMNQTNYMNIESDSFNLVPYYKVENISNN
ncbi:hypothetical protein [Winogradskyella sp. SM1960]|uniref:hypothetical protein n=1 Tax=Winogradskyella sp. SM1960 TaxID=2865955 RepID=UPI001CD47CA3|nr:hypothetical protein [Winogradskyella sp. SM1960]